MFNKKLFIIYLVIINLIISVCLSTNVFAAAAGIYTTPTLAVDATGSLWVYVGTGDKTDPAGSEATDTFYAIRDSDFSSTYTENNLENITSTSSYANDPSKHGWFLRFGGRERCLAEPLITDQKVYITSYTPAAGSSGCDTSGVAKLYIIDYLTGGGEVGTGVRSEVIGSGVASAPVVSVNPVTGSYDIYVSTSNATAGTDAHTFKATDPSAVNTPSRNQIYWHDMRVK
ncbi:MAG TPA: hypothetical protein DCR59_00030 [Dehalococcoidia bacterium]|jgi:hypothetical protein|nr:hypothetical protein [Dehalococcoidia bacterium]